MTIRNRYTLHMPLEARTHMSVASSSQYKTHICRNGLVTMIAAILERPPWPRWNESSEKRNTKRIWPCVFRGGRCEALRCKMDAAADPVETSPAPLSPRPTAPSAYSGSPPSMPSRAPLLACAWPDSNADKNLQNETCGRNYWCWHC
jgi:hypothetical protein